MLDSDTKRRDTLITVVGVWSLVLGGFTTATGFRVIYDYESLAILFGSLSYLLISTLLVLAAGIIQLTSSIALLCHKHLLQRWITLNCYVFLSLILSICICIPTTTVPYQKLQQRANEIKVLLQTSPANISEPAFVYKLGNYSHENNIGDLEVANSGYTLADSRNFGSSNPEEPQAPSQVKQVNSKSDLDELRAEHELIQFVFMHMRLFYSAMLVNFIFVPISVGIMARYVEIRFRIVRSK